MLIWCYNISDCVVDKLLAVGPIVFRVSVWSWFSYQVLCDISSLTIISLHSCCRVAVSVLCLFLVALFVVCDISWPYPLAFGCFTLIVFLAFVSVFFFVLILIAFPYDAMFVSDLWVWHFLITRTYSFIFMCSEHHTLYNLLSCQKLCDTYIFKIVHFLGGGCNVVSSFLFL